MPARESDPENTLALVFRVDGPHTLAVKTFGTCPYHHPKICIEDWKMVLEERDKLVKIAVMATDIFSGMRVKELCSWSIETKRRWARLSMALEDLKKIRK